MQPTPVALLQHWYSLVREKRPSRQDFLKALVKVFDVNQISSQVCLTYLYLFLETHLGLAGRRRLYKIYGGEFLNSRLQDSRGGFHYHQKLDERTIDKWNPVA